MTLFLGLILLLLAIGFWSSRQVKTESDFINASGRFPLFLASFSLFATWFDAGTVIMATDQVRDEGLSSIFFEPFGVGCALLMTGAFFAKPIWNLKLLTLGDFYRERFGKRAELVCVWSQLPLYVGWIALQFAALAEHLQVIVPLPVPLIMVAVALIACLLTMMGGLWSVTLTETLQIGLILGALIFLFFKVVGLHGGFETMWGVTPPPMRELKWSCLFLIASLGNVTGQDIFQRVSSSKSARTAQLSAFMAGCLYIFFGMIPALLGLFYSQLNLSPDQSVIAVLAKEYLSPEVQLLFHLALFATILSATNSGILAPATVIGHNYLKNTFLFSGLTALRVSVALVTLISLGMALSFTDHMTILEESYALGLACFFTPLFMGLFFPKLCSEAPFFISVGAGFMGWLMCLFVAGSHVWGLLLSLGSFCLISFCLKFKHKNVLVHSSKII